jgi:hypothetical protein
VFSSLPSDATIDLQLVDAFIREPEGLTVVLGEADAIRLGLPIAFRAAWLTLGVTSDLEAVGLTAAFSAALAQAGISCNVMAGVGHDHLFVPLDKADAAMAVLLELQQGAS